MRQTTFLSLREDKDPAAWSDGRIYYLNCAISSLGREAGHDKAAPSRHRSRQLKQKRPVSQILDSSTAKQNECGRTVR